MENPLKRLRTSKNISTNDFQDKVFFNVGNKKVLLSQIENNHIKFPKKYLKILEKVGFSAEEINIISQWEPRKEVDNLKEETFYEYEYTGEDIEKAIPVIKALNRKVSLVEIKKILELTKNPE